jgi:hypothetical protein
MRGRNNMHLRRWSKFYVSPMGFLCETTLMLCLDDA